MKHSDHHRRRHRVALVDRCVALADISVRGVRMRTRPQDFFDADATLRSVADADADTPH